LTAIKKSVADHWANDLNAIDTTAIFTALTANRKRDSDLFTKGRMDDSAEALHAIHDMIEHTRPGDVLTSFQETTTDFHIIERQSLPFIILQIRRGDVHMKLEDALQREFKNSPRYQEDDARRPVLVGNTKLDILNAPPLLGIRIERPTSVTGIVSRDVEVDPPFDLELPIEEAGSARYKLIGISHHRGATYRGGHYVADYWHHETDTWYHADDSVVTKQGNISQAKKASSVRLLLYQRL
jgi:hypothetical protein